MATMRCYCNWYGRSYYVRSACGYCSSLSPREAAPGFLLLLGAQGKVLLSPLFSKMLSLLLLLLLISCPLRCRILLCLIKGPSLKKQLNPLYPSTFLLVNRNPLEAGRFKEPGLYTFLRDPAENPGFQGGRYNGSCSFQVNFCVDLKSKNKQVTGVAVCWGPL